MMKNEISIKELFLFFLPLAITSFLTVITHSLFNAGMARLPSPEVMIAAFAVAKSLIQIFQSPTMMIRQTVTALIDHRKNLRKTILFLSVVILSVVILLGIIAFSGISRMLLRDVMGLSGRTLEEAIVIFRVLFIFPAIFGIRNIYQAFSIKFRTTPLVTLSSVVRITYVFIFIMLIDRLTMVQPAVLSGLMFLGAVIAETLVMIIGTRVLHKSIPKGLDAMERPEGVAEPKAITYPNIAYFYLPLIVTTLIKTVVMPVVNSGLARTVEPELAISVFAVAWSLGMIFLSPFIMFHQLPLIFCDEPGRQNNRNVRKFAFLTALVSATGLFVLAFTDLGYFVLTRLIGASQEISILAADVLKFMCLLPFLMVAREYFWGVLMKRRKTRHIWKGKAISLVSLILVITVMTFVNPANLAIIGVVGFIGAELGEFVFLYFVFRKAPEK